MMRRYQNVVAAVAVLLFFSSAELYLFEAGNLSATPRDWVTLFGALLLPVLGWRLVRRDIIDRRLGVLAIWSVAYLGISLIWYSLSPSDVGLQELRDRGFAVTFMLLAGLSFADAESRRVAGWATAFVVAVTVGINIVQMIQPDWFWMSVTTRSSGLYG